MSKTYRMSGSRVGPHRRGGNALIHGSPYYSARPPSGEDLDDTGFAGRIKSDDELHTEGEIPKIDLSARMKTETADEAKNPLRLAPLVKGAYVQYYMHRDLYVRPRDCRVVMTEDATLNGVERDSLDTAYVEPLLKWPLTEDGD